MKILDTAGRGMRKLKKSHHYLPRAAWRWARLKQARNKSLVNLINEVGGAYLSSVCPHFARNFPLGLFNLHNQEIALSHRDTVVPLAMAMAAIVPPTLLPSKIKSSKGVTAPRESYGSGL